MKNTRDRRCWNKQLTQTCTNAIHWKAVSWSPKLAAMAAQKPHPCKRSFTFNRVSDIIGGGWASYEDGQLWTGKQARENVKQRTGCENSKVGNVEVVDIVGDGYIRDDNMVSTNIQRCGPNLCRSWRKTSHTYKQNLQCLQWGSVWVEGGRVGVFFRN